MKPLLEGITLGDPGCEQGRDGERGPGACAGVGVHGVGEAPGLDHALTPGEGGGKGGAAERLILSGVLPL